MTFDEGLFARTLARIAAEPEIQPARAVAELAAVDVLALPLPGSGRTRERLDALAEVAAVDLSLARIFEGHCDAIAILAEAGVRARSGVYGVWAAEPPDAEVRAERTPAGWVLHGRKRYASGAPSIERALVTASSENGNLLFDVDLADVRPIANSWRAVGMAATESVDVDFEAVACEESALVGKAGFYLERPGFVHGAIGVAACWYGGALGAYRMLVDRLRTGADDHQAAHLGAVHGECFAMKTVLDRAADAIDEARCTWRDALIVRQLVERGCQEVLNRVGRASGSSPMVFDRAHAHRVVDLTVYLRQHHAERDLASLGRLLLGSGA